MPKPTILNPKERYSFSQYFDMNYAAEDILADLGCHLIRTRIHSPKAPTSQIASSYQFLQQYLERNLKFVNPVTEISRREVLISPTLMEVCSVGNATLNIEYNLTVSDWLRGNLDYYISTPTNHQPIHKRYHVILHYETIAEDESTFEARHNTIMGNTVVENAMIAIVEIDPDLPIDPIGRSW
jgi:hypothetical protein